MKLAAAVLITATALLGQSPLSQAQIDALIPKLRNQALRYRGQLPNFVCIQQTEIRTDASGTGKKWKQLTTSEEEVTFDGYRPQFKLLSDNGKPVKSAPVRPQDRDDPGLLAQAIVPTWIFGPKSEAALSWNRWDTIDGQRAMVLSYKVPRVVMLTLNGRAFNVGFQGLAYFMDSDQMLMRLEVAVDYDPKDAASNSLASWEIDYGHAKIGDRDFVLPAHLVLEMRHGKEWRVSDEKFSNFRQFSANSSVVEESPAR